MGSRRRWQVSRLLDVNCTDVRYSLLTQQRQRRLVSVARGEQQFFDPSGLPTAAEACKSNALMRCCKDLGIAGELWCVARASRLFGSAHGGGSQIQHGG